MLIRTIFKVAINSLMNNKLRTLLSMLGIIIGVGAVISMLALGAGAQKQVMSQVSSMGTNLLIVRPGQAGMRGVASSTQENLKVDDAMTLLQNVEDIQQVAPVSSGSVQLKYMNRNTRSSLIGTTVTYFPIRNFEIGQGRFFTEDEVDASSRVAVLGSSTAETLFGTQNPLGKTVKLNGINFRVVGVMKSKGDQGWFNPDDQAIIPLRTAMKQVLGLDYLREIDLHVREGADLDGVQAESEDILRENHRLLADIPDDFHIRNQAESLEMANNFTRMFTVLLGGIASISLLVGGIGIMNIMLVTVTERTREIGVRKAIGARDRDILRQFLFEAMVLSILGGVIGVAMGVGVAVIIDRFTEFKTLIQPFSIILSLSFAVSVGVFFGFYPALRASKLDPIDALRYE